MSDKTPNWDEVTKGLLDTPIPNEPSSEETEAVLDPNFVDDPEGEQLPQETLDGITDEEEK